MDMVFGEVVCGDQLLVTSEEDGGTPVEMISPPGGAGEDGYNAYYVDLGDHIERRWTEVLCAETASQAIALARMQAANITDEQAAQVPALYDEYVDGMVCYGEGNDAGMPVTRCRYLGQLYRFIGAGTQTMQPGWNPVDAPSLWARILPGQDGDEPEEGYADWVQPGATEGYSTGDRVLYGGHLWESIVDSNVDVPGTDNGFRWKDLGAYPPEE